MSSSRRIVLPDESLRRDGDGAPTRPATLATSAGRLGGTAGNEILTSATAAVLTVLLAAEGVTILRLHGLLTEHMFLGLMLLGPVALKLGSTGYRFARYYLAARAYREKEPPLLPLRVLAPVLVAATIAVFASGVALLLIGHRSGLVLLVHKASFFAWGACFAVHFLAYLPRVARSLRDWSAARHERVAGWRMRTLALAASLGAGLALALALLSLITRWQGDRRF